MQTILKLPPHLINQIAAGEVVERPASCIKELVENSLDAGATRIDVLLTNGGVEEICVIDDGYGMIAEDLRLCAERHTTSKLSSVEDLQKMRTFGFRGEALSSIGSVSRLEIQSRTKEMSFANALVIHHGNIETEIRPAAAPVGTSIHVKELFKQVPARLKFLRTTSTELSHCTRTVREIALGNPQTSFFLNHNGNQIARWVSKTREARFKECIRPKWSPVHITEATDHFDMNAFLSPAEVHEKGDLSIFVNSRPIRNRVLLSAARNAYREAAGPSHDPSGVIFLDIQPDWVDVNVHPQKSEVRILSQEKIYQWMVAIIRKALITKPTAEKIPPKYRESVDPPQWTPPPSPKARGTRKYLGQIRSKYLVCEDAKGLILVDPHALHEKKFYETMKGQPSSAPIPIPKVFRLEKNLEQKLESTKDFLSKAGFEIELFGDGDIAVKSRPALISEEAVEEVVLAFLQGMHNGQSKEVPEIELLPCLSAVQSRLVTQALTEQEAANLLDGFGDFLEEWKCPHGRPVIFRLNYEAITQHFETSNMRKS
jgi:DNA mismatch repair protein MutL